jgi:uncharacterized protein
VANGLIYSNTFKELLIVKNVEAKQQPYRDLAFFVDSMHGSLARKLRIFGMDAAYSSSISDEHLLWECGDQRRILLTSDKELFKRSLHKKISSVLLQGHSDKENMVKVLGEYKIREILFDSTHARCSTCNLELKRKEKAEIDDPDNLVPPKSFLHYSHFYQCVACRKIYWEGSHKPTLVSLAESVNRELVRIF